MQLKRLGGTAMERRRWQGITLIALALWGGIGGPSAIRAEDDRDLMPRLGETTAEFEARIRGLPRPVDPIAPTSVTLVADSEGHFFVESIINGSRIRMMLDTGASMVALSKEDARRIGISPAPRDFTAQVATANGVVLAAPVVLKEVAVGELAVPDIPAVVFPDNKLPVGLLGMSFLSKLSQFEVVGGRLVLKR